MLNRTIRSLNAVALLLLLGACASAPSEKLTFSAEQIDKSKRIALLWIKPCIAKLTGGCESDDGRTAEAKLAIHGAVGWVDLKQEYEDDIGLAASIARINAGPVIEEAYLRKLKTHLLNRGLSAVAVANPVYEGALGKQRRSKTVTFNEQSLLGATQFPLQVKANSFNLAPLHDSLSAEYLLVLELLRFNVERHYNSTGRPASNPHAVSAIRVSLHERDGNRVLFDDFVQKGAIVANGWNAPPHYPILNDMLIATLQNAIEEASSRLLEQLNQQ